MLKLKIGRATYDITDADEFMDNGACVQLLTQSKSSVTWGQRSSPVLSKKAIKEISQFTRRKIQRGYPKNVTVFSLQLEKGK